MAAFVAKQMVGNKLNAVKGEFIKNWDFFEWKRVGKVRKKIGASKSEQNKNDYPGWKWKESLLNF